MDRPDTRADALAAQQHGAYHLQQARSAGLSARQVRYRVEVGRLRRTQTKTFTSPAAPTSWLQDVAVACLTSGGIASHSTATALWGLQTPRTPIHVIVDRHRRRKTSGVIEHEQGPLDHADVGVVHGIPTAMPARALLGVCATTTDVRAAMLVDDAIRRRVVTREELWSLLQRVGSRGVGGASRLRRVISQRHRLADETDSFMETRFLAIATKLGLPDPLVHEMLFRDDGTLIVEADFVWKADRIVVELDGRDTHSMPDRFVKDRAATRELEDGHWRVRRFSYSEVDQIQAVEDGLRRVFGMPARRVRRPRRTTGVQK